MFVTIPYGIPSPVFSSPLRATQPRPVLRSQSYKRNLLSVGSPSAKSRVFLTGRRLFVSPRSPRIVVDTVDYGRDNLCTCASGSSPERPAVVLKFGGAAVADFDQFDIVSDIVLSRIRKNQRVAVVISAMANWTDNLIDMARKVNPNPPQREYDMLVAVGERISAALLAMALDKKGCPAISYTGSQAGILTDSEHTSARIVAVRSPRVEESLRRNEVVVVAGFQGVTIQKSGVPEVTTLGRGGSDTTAVALAAALNATHVEFFKDVPAIFDEDPKKNSQAEALPFLTFDRAIDIMEAGAKVLHPRAVKLARANGIPLHVLSFQQFTPEMFPGTVISSSPELITREVSPLTVPVYES